VIDQGSILDDPFALKILGEDEKDPRQFSNPHPLASIGHLFTATRSRIAEDALSTAVEKGLRQIVILGAGLDTFALRNPHGAREIRIYEVDHPATQAWKLERLAEAQISLPPSLTLVPVDFEQDDVGEKLVAAGFQQSSPAFWVHRQLVQRAVRWHGLFMPPTLAAHGLWCPLSCVPWLRAPAVRGYASVERSSLCVPG
jgi:methyltransferase (TIGR00027 family)